MFKKQPSCGAAVPPACEYCEHGRRAADPKMVLCDKKGVVSPYYSCKKYIYDPLQRVPRRQPKLPEFDPSEFTLD